LPQFLVGFPDLAGNLSLARSSSCFCLKALALIALR
jgi:hypothetical protein